MHRILKIIFFDILKNRIVIIYTLVLAILSWSAFALEDNNSKGLLTLLNLILLTVPLVSILFTTIYIYNSSEFIEMLLSQPIKRKTIWLNLYGALSASLLLSFLVGAGIPLIINAPYDAGFMMLILGSIVTMVFVSLAFFATVLTRDKAKGIGISMILWLYFALLFDGLVLFLLFQFSEYPIEKAMLVITAFSPLDLARILILLHLDVSAMMGYTGAIFKDFFGTAVGLSIAFFLLSLWILLPFWYSLNQFNRKDL